MFTNNFAVLIRFVYLLYMEYSILHLLSFVSVVYKCVVSISVIFQYLLCFRFVVIST